MDTLKGIVTGCLVLCVWFTDCIAQNNLPVDAGGQVVFTQCYKLKADVAEDDVYAMLQDWATHNAGKFTGQNTAPPEVSGKSKNKQAVDGAFNNPNPLQSLDPYGRRIAARGLVKYYGGPTTLISMLYIEYYMVAEVNDHKLTVTISKLNYHHFNAHTYSARSVYHWEGGKPCPAFDKLETLVEHKTYIPELDNLSAFLNGDMQRLFDDLGKELREQKVLNKQEEALISNQ